MTILESILRKPEFVGLDDEAVVVALGKTVEICRNSQRQTITDVAAKLGFQTLLEIANRLRGTAYEPLLSVVQAGCSFDDSQTLAVINGLGAAGVLSEKEVAAFKSLAVVTGPAWQREALSGLPSIEEIKAARVQIGLDDVRLKLSQRMNSVVARMDAGELATWDAVRAELGAE